MGVMRGFYGFDLKRRPEMRAWRKKKKTECKRRNVVMVKMMKDESKREEESRAVASRRGERSERPGKRCERIERRSGKQSRTHNKEAGCKHLHSHLILRSNLGFVSTCMSLTVERSRGSQREPTQTWAECRKAPADTNI